MAEKNRRDGLRESIVSSSYVHNYCFFGMLCNTDIGTDCTLIATPTQ